MCSMSTEADVLHLYLLRDMLGDAIRTMNELLEKYRGEGFDDMYCKGYRDGVVFSKEKAELMWENWKAKSWSDGIDERDLQNAKAEHEALVDE